MLETPKEKLEIYWANLCILNRMEAEKMEKAAKKWEPDKSYVPNMVYLGDTEEVKMYEKMDMDMAKGKLGFDLLISSRFDLFCSKKYLQSYKEELYPIGALFPIREEVRNSGVIDPAGLFHPLVILPHFIVVNTNLVDKKNVPKGLEDLLDPYWAEKVFLGDKVDYTIESNGLKLKVNSYDSLNKKIFKKNQKVDIHLDTKRMKILEV